MKFEDLERTWDTLGHEDPLWAVLDDPAKRGGRWAAEDFFATGRQQIYGLLAEVRELGLESGGIALDFGCAVGRLTLALAESFEHVYGVDIAPSMIELANRYKSNRNNVSYLLNRRTDLEVVGDTRFDFVYSSITLQHMRTQYAAAYVREFIRVLKDGGVLVFQLPGRRLGLSLAKRIARQAIPEQVLDSTYRRVRYGDGARMEIYGMPMRKVVSMLEGAGGRVIAIRDDALGATGWTNHKYFVVKG